MLRLAFGGWGLGFDLDSRLGFVNNSAPFLSDYVSVHK